MSLSALIRRYYIAEIPINWYGRSWGASNLSIIQMGRRYLSVLLKLFFDRMLIRDDILEERLAIRTADDGRLQHMDTRLREVESSYRSPRLLSCESGSNRSIADGERAVRECS